MNSGNTLLIISYDFPPSTGGIARLCHEIVSNIKVHYSEVEVLTLSKEAVSIPYNDNKDVKINYLPRQRLRAEFEAIRFLRNWKNKADTDVICGIWHPDAALALLAGFQHVYILAHGAELLHGDSKFRKIFWLPIYGKWILGSAKKVIANSNYTKNLVKTINPSASVEALPLGVNIDFFKPLEDEKEINNTLRICTVSRILEFKGHDFILATLCKLPKEYRKKLEWHIAGTGSFLETLKLLVKDSIMASQIHFHGFVADNDLPDFYTASDLFILPTRQAFHSTNVEGFGLVFLEAQACGLPVVGSNTGGIPDAIDHGNGGWLIEQDDIEALSNLLEQFIDEPSILAKQSKLARQRVVDSCSWKFYVKKLKDMMV